MSLLTTNLDYILATIGELKQFLLSDSIHWNLGDSSLKRSLSLGGLLLAFHDLRALNGEMPTETAAQYADAKAGMEKIRSRWETAWQAKALRELRSRLQLWKAYIQDLSDGSDRGEDYREQVRNRAIADILFEITGNSQQEAALRQSLDEWLMAHFQPSRFIWDDELAAQYPQERFWYLYGSIRNSEIQNS